MPARVEEQERPPRKQDRRPVRENEMTPRPVLIREDYKGADKLKGQAVLITGGDGGIGRAAAVHFAREGADVAIAYLEEQEEAEETKKLVEAEGRRCILLLGDVGSPAFCRQAVRETVEAFGRLDVLLNNAAERDVERRFEDIAPDQLARTFLSNVFGYFHMAQAALPALEKNKGRIINMASVAAREGNPLLIDCSATTGAVVSFSRALAESLAPRGIRVNSVEPGPIWTPLIPAASQPEEAAQFGRRTPMGRAGQPAEVGACCVFLAGEDSSYITGQTLHPNGGQMRAS